MKTSKQNILDAYNQSQETINQMQTNAWKTMLLQAVTAISSYLLYQFKGENFANSLKGLAEAIAPVLVYLYVFGETTGLKSKQVWLRVSNSLVLDPVIN